MTPEPGACGDPSCPVLHADPANPIHPPWYEPGGPLWDDVLPADRALISCPRSSDPTDTDPHYPHRWGDPADPGDGRICPGREEPTR